MKLMNKMGINKVNIAEIFFYLFIISLFFPIRYVFPTMEAFQTGAYSDFTSISLYLSDIFLIITFLWIILSNNLNLFENVKIIWLKIKSFRPFSTTGLVGWLTYYPLSIFIIWLVLGLIWHFRIDSRLNWYFFGKYLELVVAYETTKLLILNRNSIKSKFLELFLILSSFESIVGLLQFLFQHSIGLNKLGEEIIGPNVTGAAKIVLNGTKYIRGYGTFPHPNLLSSFLVMGVLIALYLYLNSKNNARLLSGVLIIINLLGLAVTYSRAGYLALIFALIIYFGVLVYNRFEQKKILWSSMIIIASLLLIFFSFTPFLLTRATVTDQSSLERIFYAKLGLQIIEHNPLFGVGIGESMLHMQQYSPIKLWPWEIQPVPNYFLLAAADIGIIGSLILASFFLSLLWKLCKRLLWSRSNFYFTNYNLLLITILVAFLVLMQFDHYFYTLQQTQMLLWVILGLVAAQIKNPSPQEKG